MIWGFVMKEIIEFDFIKIKKFLLCEIHYQENEKKKYSKKKIFEKDISNKILLS